MTEVESMHQGVSGAKQGALPWTGRTLGGMVLFKSCIWMMRHFGIRFAHVGSYVIAVGFLVVGGRRQWHSMAYWRRVRPQAGTLVHWMLIWRRYASFGRILCDRLLVFEGPERFTFTHSDPTRLQVLAGKPGGFILLAAHLGNWELSGFRLAKLSNKRVNLVMVRSDEARLQHYVDVRLRGDKISVIDPRDSLGASLSIHGALTRGEIVCILGDRTLGDQPSVACRFLGGTARFPIGPFHAAALTGVPIITCFLMKRGMVRYHLDVGEPWYLTLPPRGHGRREALAAAAQLWADRLAHQVRRFPLQWHNFYDFWGT